MTDEEKEELLARAKRDYPIGTKFKSASSGTIEYVKKEPFYWHPTKISIAVKESAGIVYT